MVRGKDDLLYTRLAERYNNAVLKEQAAGPFAAPKLPVEPVVRDHDTAMEAIFVVEWWGDHQSTPGNTDDCPMGQGTAFVHRELNLLVTCGHALEGVANVNGHPFDNDYEAPDIHGRRPQEPMAMSVQGSVAVRINNMQMSRPFRAPMASGSSLCR